MRFSKLAGFAGAAFLSFGLRVYGNDCVPARAGATHYIDAASTAGNEDGSASRPYRSFASAMANLNPGDTLNIRSGVYRESLILPARDWGNRFTVIQADKGANVLIKGSDAVIGWDDLGGGTYVKHKWAFNSQQVFVDGIPLKQIGGVILKGFPEDPKHAFAKLHRSNGGIWPGRIPGGFNELIENSFYYDRAAQDLYIKVSYPSLTGHLVEVSARPFLLKGNQVNCIYVRNLKFEHSNTSDENMNGAISLTGNDIWLDHIEAVNMDGNCADISGDRVEITDSKFNYCGIVGLKVRGRNAKLFNNETSHNNTRGFNKWWEAGGAKFVGNGGLIDSEIAGHKAFFNNADGIWFDWLNSNNFIHDNISAYNNGFGIQYESSQGAVIYNNIIYGNKQRGIYLPQSSGVTVAKNLVVKNGLEGIVAIDQGVRDNQNRADLTPRSNKIIGNIIAWHTKPSVILPENKFDNISESNLILLSQPGPAFGLGWGSREHPLISSLQTWQSVSGQDLYSKMQIFNNPSLSEAIDAQRTDIDWSPMMELAQGMKFPSEIKNYIDEALPKNKRHTPFVSRVQQ